MKMISVTHEDGFCFSVKYSRLRDGKIRVTIPNYDMEDVVLRNDFRNVLVENGWCPLAIDILNEIIFQRPWNSSIIELNADTGHYTES